MTNALSNAVRRAFIGRARGDWLLALLIAVTAALFYRGVVRYLPMLDTPFRVPWLVVLLLTTLAESAAVHIQFRREAHSVSLSEIPLVIGLYVLSPTEVVLAHVLGSLMALLLRKQSPMKLVFNLSQFFLGATLASSIFHSIVDNDSALSLTGMLTAFMAASVTSLVSIVAIATAISILEGRGAFEKVPEMLKFGFATTLGNTSLGVMGVTMLWRSTETTWVLLVPALALLFAVRAYSNARSKQEGLEFLFESTQLLQRPQLGPAVVDLLEHSREMFHAEVAELTLVSESGDAMRTRVGPGDEVHEERGVPLDLDHEPWRTVVAAQGVVVARPSHSLPGVADLLGEHEVRDAMLTVLKGEGRFIGTMVVANREAATAEFGDGDVQLLETLGGQITVVWENGRLEESLDRLQEVGVQLSYQAHHDSLTGLANRSQFTDRLRDAMLMASVTGNIPAILFVDLDDFKTVNDRFGHAAGDQVLAAVASRIRACVRPTDTPARVGGDEFAVLLPGSGGVQTAVVIGERVLEAVRAPIPVQGATVTVGVSVGVATPNERDVSIEQLLRDADTAMYAAKSGGKGRVAVFEPRMRASEQERTVLLAELRNAVGTGQITLHYQPVVDLPTGRVAGVEALLRWDHPRKGLLAPGDFLDLAEHSGLLVPMGALALRMACAQAQVWHSSGLAPGLSIGVNVSASQLQHETLLTDVRVALDETGCDPRALVLEVSETTVMQASEEGVAALHELHDLGVSIAVDDYGTGYSSLSYLAKLPIDVFKIAKPFIDGLASGAEDVALAKAIVRLGQALGREVIAVGIETDEQRRALQALGCTLGQGYLYAGAMPAVELEPALATGFSATATGMLG